MFWVRVIACLFILFGIVCLTDPDAMWRYQEWSNRAQGAKSERTDTWERGNKVTGWLLIALGLFLLFAPLS
jgi:uncharacterized membrane protein HdeD (DUF308 family)